MTERTVEEAKVLRRVATELIPVVASVALVVMGVIRSNLAMVSAGIGILGVPGVVKAVDTIRGTERTSDA